MLAALAKSAGATPASSEIARDIDADLSGAMLVGADLSQTDLSRATLAAAELGAGRLAEYAPGAARLTGATLVKANFTGANLKNVDLREAILTGATFSGADLGWADLTWARASGANFSRASLAWAIAEYLHDNPQHAAKTLFATHYHEMTELAKLLPGVRNYQMAVKETGGTIVFLRRVGEGTASKSYGIEVARLAGLPRTVTERAREILLNLEANELAGSPGRLHLRRHRQCDVLLLPQA